MIQSETTRALLEEVRGWAAEELKAAKARTTRLREGGEAYNHAIQSVRELTYFVQQIGYDLEGESTWDTPAPLGESFIEAGPPVNAPDPEPEPEPTEPERPIPKLEDVRGKCGEAKKAGVDIKGILNDLGYKNLSSVDPKDYNTLLDKVNAALEEIG